MIAPSSKSLSNVSPDPDDLQSAPIFNAWVLPELTKAVPELLSG